MLIRMKKNQTNPIVKEADDFDITDKNLLFNVLLFVILFTLLAVSFLIFRGMKKNSKYSNDIYAVDDDSDDDENGNRNMKTLLLSSDFSGSSDKKINRDIEVSYLPPTIISSEVEVRKY